MNVWRVSDSRHLSLVKVFENHENIAWAVDANDQFLVSCSEDCSIAVYDTGQHLDNSFCYKIANVSDRGVASGGDGRGHSKAVTCLKLRESFLVTGSRDKTVRLWRIFKDRSVSLL